MNRILFLLVLSAFLIGCTATAPNERLARHALSAITNPNVMDRNRIFGRGKPEDFINNISAATQLWLIYEKSKVTAAGSADPKTHAGAGCTAHRKSS